MNHHCRLILLLFFFGLFLSPVSSQVCINEFMASNAITLPDIVDYDDYSDWIEIYNLGDYAVSIGGWYLTDDLTEPNKWQFPNSLTLPAKTHLLIWADGCDNSEDNFEKLHANFKLSRAGEVIGLYNKQGTLIDTVVFGYQPTDVSWGRKQDGADSWCYFGEPTPEAPNNTPNVIIPNYADAAIFSVKGGYFNISVILKLSSATENAEIRYTTDCSMPNSESLLFNSAIIFDTTTIVRARVYKNGFIPSEIITHSYFFNENNNNIPTISLTAFPETLWGSSIGIYLKSLKGIKIPTNFEYFERDNEQKISQLTDLRISGQASYKAPQKPFTISAKGKYGNSYLSHPFFNSREITDFKDIYLRNSGTPDAFFTMFRDGLTHSIVINKLNIDCQAYQPARVFLNGEYWGIYNIREKINKNYLQNLHNVNRNNINILEYPSENNPAALEGSNEDFMFMWKYIKDISMEDPKNYEFVKSKIDIDEFIDYQIAEIYLDNVDWGSSNMQWWKENTYNSKWRYIMLDTDVSYGLIWDVHNMSSHYYHNNLLRSMEFMTQAYLFKRLLANIDFKNEFVGRFAVLLNTVFNSTRTLHLIDSLQNNIYNEMPNHIERWRDYEYSYYGEPIEDMDDWESEVEVMREFARKRPEYQRQHIMSRFGLTGMDSLITKTLPLKSGSIYINDILIADTTAAGLYFHDIDIRLKAIPKIGYKFIGWQGEFSSSNNDTVITLNSKIQITARFVIDDISIIPNEITEEYTLRQTESPYYSNGNVIIKPNATMYIEPGVEIIMSNKACFYVYGNINAMGTETNYITIRPNYNSGADFWGNICFKDGTSASNLNHIYFENSTSPKHSSNIYSYNTKINLNHLFIDSKSQPFYSEYGDVEIINCNFHSDIASDLINIKYANTALVENCTLTGNETVDADAIDYDYITDGVIRGNFIGGFIGYNSDGIDLGEEAKNIIIENNTIFNCADKGISIGQASTAVVKNNIISYCNQGLGIKDFGSYAKIDKNTFYENFYAVACFEKNFSEGGGTADVTNCIIANSRGSSFYVDNLSTINTLYTLSNTDIIEGNGNIFSNPMFNDELCYNFGLLENSPCINSGDPLSPLDADGTVTDMGATYTHINTVIGNVIINEINYHSSTANNTNDWIELYNTTDRLIDLSGWSFLDSKNSHTFIIPDGIQLKPNEYFVLCRDDSAFQANYPYVSNYYGGFDFGLSNDGEILRLFNSKMNLVNSVTYKNANPWPIGCAGSGYTLELIAENLDNSEPDNWRKSPYILGSPGKTNNPKVLADFIVDVYSDCSGLVYCRNISGAPIDSIIWDFGDGTTDTANYLEHVYNNPGVYTLKLKVFNFFGSNEKNTELIFENTVEQPTVYGDTICDNGYLTLKAEGDGTMLWFKNRFGGNPFFEGTEYATEYLQHSETYYVSCNIDDCESNRVEVEAKVYKNPLSYFIFDLDNGLVTTKNVSRNCDNYYWDFGDGYTSTEFEPIHQYAQNGNYTLKLKVENTFCDEIDRSSRTVEVIISDIENNLISTMVKVYPNPTSGVFTIENQKNIYGNLHIDIYNIFGQKVKVVDASNVKAKTKLKIHLTNEPTGIYIININMGNRHILKKIIVQ